MFFKIFNKGFAGSNSYILGDGNEAIVIDAGNAPEDIYEAAVREGLRIKMIILTHGHFDHMIYLDELQRKTNAKIAIHEKDAEALTDSGLNVSQLFRMPKKFKSADIRLRDGDIINLGKYELNIIHTPGHTPGGICILCENMLFTGDTLFDGDFGRVDLPGGDGVMLRKSLERIFALNLVCGDVEGNPGQIDDMIVYPGHDSSNKLSRIISKCSMENLLDDENWME